MDHIIQSRFGARTTTKSRETKQTGTQANSFPDMAAQTSSNKTNTLTTSMSGIMGMVGLPTNLMMDLASVGFEFSYF